VLPPVQRLSVLFPAVTGLRENQTNYFSNYQTNYLSNYPASLFTWSWHSCRGALAQGPMLSGNLPGSFSMTWRPRSSWSSSHHTQDTSLFLREGQALIRLLGWCRQVQWPFCCQADYRRARYLCCTWVSLVGISSARRCGITTTPMIKLEMHLPLGPTSYCSLPQEKQLRTNRKVNWDGRCSSPTLSWKQQRVHPAKPNVNITVNLARLPRLTPSLFSRPPLESCLGLSRARVW